MRCTTFAAVFALLAIPSIARAHGGNDDANLVHACLGNGSDIVRIVGVNGSCRAGETPVHWAIQGPQGDPGINGINGINGSNGAPGINGTNGTNGTNGIDGKDGAAGPAGPAGPAGAACLPTDPACVGPQGDTGPQGPQGAKGDTGDQGAPGPGAATFWAVVATHGPTGAAVPNANSNLITATRLRTGSYRIAFPSTLASCAIVANIRGSVAGGFDAANFEVLTPGLFVAFSFFGGATHLDSLDVQIRTYGGTAPITGVLADGLTFNIVVFC